MSYTISIRQAVTVFIMMPTPPIPRTLPGIEQALSKHLLNE